jgi:hypothetical protein
MATTLLFVSCWCLANNCSNKKRDNYVQNLIRWPVRLNVVDMDRQHFLFFYYFWHRYNFQQYKNVLCWHRSAKMVSLRIVVVLKGISYCCQQ